MVAGQINFVGRWDIREVCGGGVDSVSSCVLSAAETPSPRQPYPPHRGTGINAIPTELASAYFVLPNTVCPFDLLY